MSVEVRLAALLHGYTGGQGRVAAEGHSVAEIVSDLDRRFPGLAFRIIDEQGRIRPHMKIFVGQDLAPAPSLPVAPNARLYIVGALSGGR